MQSKQYECLQQFRIPAKSNCSSKQIPQFTMSVRGFGDALALFVFEAALDDDVRFFEPPLDGDEGAAAAAASESEPAFFFAPRADRALAGAAAAAESAFRRALSGRTGSASAGPAELLIVVDAAIARLLADVRVPVGPVEDPAARLNFGDTGTAAAAAEEEEDDDEEALAGELTNLLAAALLLVPAATADEEEDEEEGWVIMLVKIFFLNFGCGCSNK